MKSKILALLFGMVCIPLLSTAQQGMWTWVKGDSTPNGTSVYGTVGVPSPTNKPEGRYACVHWTDTAGHFWIYGGQYTGLWMFDPGTTEWTFIRGKDASLAVDTIVAAKGVFAQGNVPGSAVSGKAGWVTPDNHLWLIDDAPSLWQYDPAINEWAWMGATSPVNYGTKGTGTTTTLPGFRAETSAAWVDSSGNLWLFGGYNGGGCWNDMWEYTVSTGIWTWMSGTNIAGNTGNYGALNTPSVNNVPPARVPNTCWKDSSGNFWFAGGEYLTSGPFYQDVWRFNPTTLEWTWMSGTQGPDTSAPSGTLCVANSSNKQGYRYENRAVWKVCDNLIINYSGQSVAGPSHYYNDLWAYIPSLGQWMEMASGVQNGSYGIQGVASAANFPPARVGGVGFVDRSKNLWLFGGMTYRGAAYNDLWEYIIDTGCTSVANCFTSVPVALQANATAANDSCNGACDGSASVTATSGTPPYRYLWQPGNDTTAVINNLCAGNYNVTVTDFTGATVAESVTVTAPSPVQITITPDSTFICPGDSAQICAPSGFAAYRWNSGVLSACITTSIAGDYEVTATDNNGCPAVSNQANLSVYQPTHVNISINGDTIRAYNAISYQWNFEGHILVGDTGSTLIATQGGNYTVTIGDAHGCFYTSSPITITGTDNISTDEEISIYPNPLQNGSWHLLVSDRLIGNWVEIYDEAGRLVYRAQIENPLTEIKLNVAGGVYLLKINAGSNNIIRKLVKL